MANVVVYIFCFDLDKNTNHCHMRLVHLFGFLFIQGMSGKSVSSLDTFYIDDRLESKSSEFFTSKISPDLTAWLTYASSLSLSDIDRMVASIGG